MMGIRISSLCKRIAVLMIFLYSLWQGLDAVLSSLNSSESISYILDWRTAAKNAPKGGLALLCDDISNIKPVERSRLIAMSWERAPYPIAVVDAQCDIGKIDVILSSKWISNSKEKWLKDNQFISLTASEYVNTWIKSSAISRSIDVSPAQFSHIREVCILIIEFLLMLVIFAKVLKINNVNKWQMSILGIVAVLLGIVAISHPLLPPNGLGIYGGKAKLLYECGGIPKTFLESVGGEVLQTLYPPGLTLLTYMHFLLSGGCGDRFVQLLVVFAMVFICLVMVQRVKIFSSAMIVILFCLSPITVRMSSGFYAEPFVALMLLVGWVKISDGRFFIGCFLMGLAGFFRLEAGVVAALLAMVTRADNPNVRNMILGGLLSLSPLLFWLLIARLCGYRNVSDWDFCSLPKIGNIVYAAWCEIRTLGLYALPIIVIHFFSCSRKALMCRENIVAIIPMLILLVLIPLVCAFYTSPYASWMMDNTIPRLLWYISIIPLYELLCCSNRGKMLVCKLKG